jgi:hypothetical protein
MQGKAAQELAGGGTGLAGCACGSRCALAPKSAAAVAVGARGWS